MKKMQQSPEEDHLIQNILRLGKHLTPARRVQMIWVMVLLFAGAIAELATIATLAPFLAVITDPQRVSAYPIVENYLRLLDWGRNDDPRLPMAIVFGTTAVFAAVIRIMLLWASQKFIYHLGYDLAVEVYRRALNQPYSFHVATNSSELIGGLSKIQLLVVVLISALNVVAGIVISCFILVALFAVNAKIAASSTFAFILVYATVSFFTRKKLRRNSSIISSTQESRLKAVQEGIAGIKNVILDRTQDMHLRKFSVLEFDFRDAQAVNGIIGGVPRFIIESAGMLILSFLVIVLIGSDGRMQDFLPAVGVLALGAQRMLPMLQQVYFGIVQMTGNRAVLSDVVRLLELPMEERRLGADQICVGFDREISVDHVSFGYIDRSRATLQNIVLTIPKGARIGFVGSTGSGKSTLADLLMGLLSPEVGAIRVDNTPLTADNIVAWQKLISHVPQAIYLTDASIAQNIAYDSEHNEIDWVRLKAVAELADLAEFVGTLPEGYQTIVGERGVRLSGGQRQRIGIARALYKDSQLLILDEATSALDPRTEEKVMRAIHAMAPRKTVIIIAHRLSTIEQCEIIILLEDGKVVGTGTYEELARSNKQFRKLVTPAGESAK